MSARINAFLRNSGWLLGAVLLSLLLFSGTVYAEGEIPQEPVPQPDADAALTAGEPIPDSALETPAAEVPQENSSLTPQPDLSEPESPAEDAPAPVTAEVILPEEEALPNAAEEAPASSAEETILVDGLGEILALASQQSADALASGDPWFMVGLTTYRFFEAAGVCAVSYPGDPNCLDSQGSDVIQDALNYMDAGSLLPTDRKLHVEAGTYDRFYLINSSTIWPQLNGVIGAGAWQTSLNGDVIVEDVLNGFLLQGFKINGNILMINNTGLVSLQDLDIGSGNFGFVINDQKGPVVVNEVNASDHPSLGGFINNKAGKSFVKITNSSFNNNGSASTDNGLHILTSGPVTIEGVTANGNSGNGIEVVGFSSLTVRNAILHDNKDADNNYYFGIGLYGATDLPAPVILEHVYASNNHTGILIDSDGSLNARYVEANANTGPNDCEDGLHVFSDGPLKVEFSQFDDNGKSGLYADTGGGITLNSIRAEGNGSYGANLLTSRWDAGLARYTGVGAITITSPADGGAPQANYFNNNGQIGLAIESSRSVTINNIDIYGNGTHGLFLDNCLLSGSACQVSGSVTMGVTIPNWLNGIYGNGASGAYIQSSGAVSISATSADMNTGVGMDVFAWGVVKLTGVSASGNSLAGANINNKVAAVPKTVLLKDCVFDNNHNGSGLLVVSEGAVVASGLTASHNSQGGALFNNTYGSAGVSILPSGSTYATVFDGNGSQGLSILTDGSILINGISANGNGDNGLDLNNGTSMAVTVQNTRSDGFVSTFDGNGWDGISVYTWGDITLKNISASGNALSGADLDNCIYNPGPNACTRSGNITVNASAGVMNEFSNNGDFGLRSLSRGTIKIVNVGAYDNNNSGVRLQNNYTNSAAGVIVTSSGNMRSEFNHNTLTASANAAGLWITSNGTIPVSKVDANNNQTFSGIFLLNGNAPTPKTIIASDLNTQRQWFQRPVCTCQRGDHHHRHHEQPQQLERSKSVQ